MQHVHGILKIKLSNSLVSLNTLSQMFALCNDIILLFEIILENNNIYNRHLPFIHVCELVKPAYMLLNILRNVNLHLSPFWRYHVIEKRSYDSYQDYYGVRWGSFSGDCHRPVFRPSGIKRFFFWPVYRPFGFKGLNRWWLRLCHFKDFLRKTNLSTKCRYIKALVINNNLWTYEVHGLSGWWNIDTSRHSAQIWVFHRKTSSTFIYINTIHW